MDCPTTADAMTFILLFTLILVEDRTSADVMSDIFCSFNQGGLYLQNFFNVVLIRVKSLPTSALNEQK